MIRGDHSGDVKILRSMKCSDNFQEVLGYVWKLCYSISSLTEMLRWSLTPSEVDSFGKIPPTPGGFTGSYIPTLASKHPFSIVSNSPFASLSCQAEYSSFHRGIGPGKWVLKDKFFLFTSFSAKVPFLFVHFLHWISWSPVEKFVRLKNFRTPVIILAKFLFYLGTQNNVTV